MSVRVFSKSISISGTCPWPRPAVNNIGSLFAHAREFILEAKQVIRYKFFSFRCGQNCFSLSDDVVRVFVF